MKPLNLFFCVAAACAAVAAASAFAQAPAAPKTSPKDAHKAETIAQHRAMAKAHEDAAKCLESGKSEEQCHEQLRKDCKGLGIGRFCGLRHSH
ncbi:hypothetical protein [Piscinibacterium candidicorallinum]|jgi:hypothetical protein|uniref:PsiF repeat-containing protein n=1 Tax=Piscinibacterium candidicorallinum TaxID=1793872 RepID=A0ABV7H624_9BURK